ncbi:MAG: hypothetical protein WAK66_12940 [Methylocystis sp.]
MNIMIIVGSLDMSLFSNEEVARRHAWPFARRSVGKISFAFVHSAFGMALLEIISGLGRPRRLAGA